MDVWVSCQSCNNTCLVSKIQEDFYNFMAFLCPTSRTSGTAVAGTLLMIFSTRIAIAFHFSTVISYQWHLLLGYLAFKNYKTGLGSLI